MSAENTCPSCKRGTLHEDTTKYALPGLINPGLRANHGGAHVALNVALEVRAWLCDGCSYVELRRS
jgi:hypothetical protein